MATEDQEGIVEINIEEIDDSVVPFYLQEKPIYKAYVKEIRRREEEATYDHLTGKNKQRPAGKAGWESPSSSVVKWQVCTPDLNGWRENHLDDRSIYHLREDTLSLADDETRTRAERRGSAVSRVSIVSSGVALQQEKAYIESVQQHYRMSVRCVPRHVLTHTMKEYHRPTACLPVGSYGSPRLQSSHAPVVGVQTMPVKRLSTGSLGLTSSRSGSPCKQARPGAKSEFCDVLGPVSCQRCIESVNRHIASDLQGKGFPLDCTAANLVRPTLLKLMSRSPSADKSTSVVRDNPTRKDIQSQFMHASRRDFSNYVKLPVLQVKLTHRNNNRPKSLSMQRRYLQGNAAAGSQKPLGNRRRLAIDHSSNKN